MAKIRLNAYKREKLIAFAIENIKCPEEEKEMKQTYLKAKEDVEFIVNSKFPPKDIKILEKYKLTREKTKISLVDEDRNYVEFRCEDGDSFTLPTSQTYYSPTPLLTDNETIDLVNKYNKAKDKYTEAFENKISMYKTLIREAKTFDEVCEVWPAAKQLKEKFGIKSTALTVLSEDMISKIKEDNAGSNNEN